MGTRVKNQKIIHSKQLLSSPVGVLPRIQLCLPFCSVNFERNTADKRLDFFGSVMVVVIFSDSYNVPIKLIPSNLIFCLYSLSPPSLPMGQLHNTFCTARLVI